jgi:hypothetical protein
VVLGYVSRKKSAKISWKTLSQEPSSWIKPECAPHGFPWADPSKIQIDDVYLLLDHWRQRLAHGLKPLIWASSCPLLKYVRQPSEHSEESSEARNKSDTRSEDNRSSAPEHRDDTTSDDESSTSSDDYEKEDEEPMEDYIKSPLSPEGRPLRASSGTINLFSVDCAICINHSIDSLEGVRHILLR